MLSFPEARVTRMLTGQADNPSLSPSTIWPKRIQQLISAVLLLSVGWFAFRTIHWPLVGDASLIHYVVFLMDRGLAPYRDIVDINLPASYLPDWTIIHLFGPSALPWRLYDLSLLVIATAAMAVISRRSGWFPALWAGCLFALIHGRDGLEQVGQRDLTAGVLLLIGTATLLWATRTRRTWAAALFGLCVGLATMIKPTLAPFLLLALSTPRNTQGMPVEQQTMDRINHRNAPPLSRGMLAASTGWLLPVLLCLIWLQTKGSLSAFWQTLTILAPYHATLGHPHIHPLLRDWFSPILPIILAWLIVLAINHARSIASPPSPTAENHQPHSASLSTTENQHERRTLLWAVLLGAFSYLAQFKGYPYHRYPLFLFLLLLIAIDLTNALTATTTRAPQPSTTQPQTTHTLTNEPPANRTQTTQALSAAILLWASLILAPSSALKASHYNWRNEEFRLTLQADLQDTAHRLQVPSLSGKIQCLDTISGCINTLYDMQLTQTTGHLYDEFLFHPPGSAAIDATRAAFFQAMQANPPLAIVVTDPLFPSGPNHYAKLTHWPEFTLWLNQRYQLDAERHLTQPKQWVGQPIIPPGYRLYTLKASSPQTY
jgi:hypothetical protein